MAVRRPGFAVFGMSFLDVIGSAFGAILLVFLMVSVMCSARAIERTYLMLQVKLDAYDGVSDQPIEGLPVTCRAMVLVPNANGGSPANFEQLSTQCDSFDLRQISSEARAGRVDDRLRHLASEIIVNSAFEDGAVVVMRGVKPKQFWIVILIDQQLPKSVSKVKVRVASIDGDIAPEILKQSQAGGYAIVDTKQLSKYVENGEILREHFGEAALVIPVKMKVAGGESSQQK